MELSVILLIAYLSGCVVTWDIIELLKTMGVVEYEGKDKLYIILGSWISAIVLNSMMKND